MFNPMLVPELKKIADDADMIINGYAFTRCGNMVRVINLDHPSKTAVIDDKLRVTETTMNDIEIDIMMDYYVKDKKYMED